jgi:hypothetical protein
VKAVTAAGAFDIHHHIGLSVVQLAALVAPPHIVALVLADDCIASLAALASLAGAALGLLHNIGEAALFVIADVAEDDLDAVNMDLSLAVAVRTFDFRGISRSWLSLARPFACASGELLASSCQRLHLSCGQPRAHSGIQRCLTLSGSLLLQRTLAHGTCLSSAWTYQR